MSLLTKIFGDANQRFLNLLSARIVEVSAHEDVMRNLSDESLRKKTDEFKKNLEIALEKNSSALQELGNDMRRTLADEEKNRLKKQLVSRANEPLDAILPEAFAVVREAALRTLQQCHFDVQLMGGIVLHDGQVAEMKTGEGKTLTSTLAIYLNALSGRGVHVVTVNDYLARRDAVWMAQIFHFLGLTVGVIVHDASFRYDPDQTSESQDAKRDLGVTIEHDFLRPVSRKEAYSADVTYGTNNEFGFDYLRDNMVMDMGQKVQRELHYAIIDEVDSILIDEARTPLIISAPDTKSTDQYFQFAQIVNGLDENADYNVDEKMRAATLTESGVAKVEKILNVENIYVEKGIRTIHHIEQALRAKTLYRLDKDYTVKDGQVLIVDEFTGRLLPGRRYSEGLHQAIEAKEGLEIQRESRTMATITFQNYFRLYHKLAGMTGTAETEAEELAKIYNLDVTTIPTNKPMIRKDLGDRIYKTAAGKFSAVVQEIKQRNIAGQPVLVGTISIEKNELLAQLLEREGLRFNLLNAKQHEKEAETIAQAGAKGAITIATNMAGRGVDIKLGGLPFDQSKCDEIIKLGGLHVIGTERHESRRIDNQLRGRSGRQGEPGSSQFYVSLDDDLMRIFGAERVKMLMKNWPEDMPIENGFISKSLESAQKKVEGHNFDIRKHLVEYDDVINKQRTYAYNKRDQYLMLHDADEPEVLMKAKEEIRAEIEELIAFHTASETRSQWNTKEIEESAFAMMRLSDKERNELKELLTKPENPGQMREGLVKHLYSFAETRFDRTVEALDTTLRTEMHRFPAREIITTLYLRSLDMLWIEHLETINYLRTGIGLRGYGQRDPLVEYKRESKDLFNRLFADIQKQFVYSVLNLTVGTPTNVSQTDAKQRLEERKQSLEAFGAEKTEGSAEKIQSKPKNKEGVKIGRNDPCYCGSGKKFKKCHGA